MPFENENELSNIPKIPQNLSDKELEPIFDNMLTNPHAGAKKMMLNIYKSDLSEEEKNKRIFFVSKAASCAGVRTNEGSVEDVTKKINQQLANSVNKEFANEIFIKQDVLHSQNDIYLNIPNTSIQPGLLAIKQFTPKNKLNPELRNNFLTMAYELEKAGLTDLSYVGENDKKTYGFYEYRIAQENLDNALKEGNYEKVVDAYNTLEKTEQKYMALIQKTEELLGTDRLCDNVDIARESMYPDSFKKHNIACSNINSVYYFVGLCKLMNVPFEDAIDHFSEIVPQKIVDLLRTMPGNEKYIFPKTEPIGKRLAGLRFSENIEIRLGPSRAFEPMSKLESDPIKAAENCLYFLKADIADSIYQANLRSVFGKDLRNDMVNGNVFNLQAMKNMLVLGSTTDDLTVLNPNLINPVTCEKNVIDYEGYLKNLTLDENFIRQSMQNLVDFVEQQKLYLNDGTDFSPLTVDISETEILLATREVVADLVRIKGYDKSNVKLDRLVKNFLYYPGPTMNDYLSEQGKNYSFKFPLSDKLMKDVENDISENFFLHTDQIVANAKEIVKNDPLTPKDLKDAIVALDMLSKRKGANTKLFAEWNERVTLDGHINELTQLLQKMSIEGIPFPINKNLINTCLKDPAKIETLIDLYKNDLKSKITPETTAIMEEMKGEFNSALGVTEANPSGSNYSVSNYAKAMLNLVGKHVSQNPDNPTQQMLKSRAQVIADARAFESKVRGITMGYGCADFAHTALLNGDGTLNETKINALNNCLTDDQIYTAYTRQLNVASLNVAAQNVAEGLPDFNYSENPQQSLDTFKEKMGIAKSLMEVRSTRTFWWKLTHRSENNVEKAALANMKQAIINKGMPEDVYNQYMNSSSTEEKNVMDDMCRQLNEKYLENAPAEVDLNESFVLEKSLAQEIFAKQIKDLDLDDPNINQPTVDNQLEGPQN